MSAVTRARCPTASPSTQRGLVPVVVQDRASGDVLMVAYANAEALARHRAHRRRALLEPLRRQALWKKGETSGHVLRVREMRAPTATATRCCCVVDPDGPDLPHRRRAPASATTRRRSAGVLEELERVIAERAPRAGRDGSYTARLLAERPRTATLKKVGEEATEVVLAAKGESDERLAEEAADLLYHLLVVLRQRKRAACARVLDVLRRRRRAPRP